MHSFADLLHKSIGSLTRLEHNEEALSDFINELDVFFENSHASDIVGMSPEDYWTSCIEFNETEGIKTSGLEPASELYTAWVLMATLYGFYVDSEGRLKIA
jgi:hypothetical protein